MSCPCSFPGKSTQKSMSWARTGSAIPLRAVGTAPYSSAWTSFTLATPTAPLSDWCLTSAAWETQSILLILHQMRKCLLKSQTTKEEQHTSPLSCLHPTGTKHTRALSKRSQRYHCCLPGSHSACRNHPLYSLLPLVLHAGIHKNNVWVHHGCVRWSQCPNPRKGKAVLVWPSLNLSWTETCFVLWSNCTCSYPSCMEEIQHLCSSLAAST